MSEMSYNMSMRGYFRKHFERRLLIMKKSIRIMAVVMALLMVTLVFAS